MPDRKKPAESLSAARLLDPCNSLAYTDILVLSPTPTAPTDQGNRKRIHSVCSELKRRGARVHFVYYPHEWWFSFAPMDLAREMSAQWDSFHLLPATRPLHTRAAGEDHTIDEWWDKAIGKYLKWLFAHAHYDAFIVNYAYLSRAFKYAPKHTLKILDTHDKMTGRRELLEANGVPREFFYTTRDQEAIALDRAQLVWAIKDEEAEFFRSISRTPCVTMPHVEPPRPTVRQRSAEDESYLVIGMLGAHNSINTSNARSFVDDALPCFKRELAPVKIRFAGSMCTALDDLRQPGVEILGPVANVEEFYAAVDVVVVPLAFSTGLKIKAVEAIASGMPLVAMGHALEGIPTDHPFHRCPSAAAMAEACIQLAHDPALLQRLKEATLETYGRIEQQAIAAFDTTAWQINRKRTFVMLLDRLFFDLQSPYREHALQVLREFSPHGRVVLFFDQPIPLIQGSLFAQLNTLVHQGKICLTPEAAGDRPHSLGMMSFVASLDELLLNHPHNTLWALRVPPALAGISDEAAARTALYLRVDALRRYQPDAFAGLAKQGRRFGSLTLVDGSAPGSSPELAPWLAAGHPLHSVPFWKYLPHTMHIQASRTDRIDILVTGDQIGFAELLADSLDEACMQKAHCRLVLATDGGPSGINVTHETVAAHDLMESFRALVALPGLVVDLGGDTGNAAMYLETMRQAKVPIFYAMAPCLSDGRRLPASLLDRIETLLAVGTGRLAIDAQRSKSSLGDNEAGWHSLRKTILAAQPEPSGGPAR